MQASETDSCSTTCSLTSSGLDYEDRSDPRLHYVIDGALYWLVKDTLRTCAHIISLIGAWVQLSSTHPPSNGVCSLIICVLGWICSSSWGVGADIEIAYGDDVPVSGAL
jgi:hypothetical protein